MDATILQLDHVVLAVHELARAADDFRALGFTVTPGGEHAGRSSHNALVVFDDGAYIEIIAWRAAAPDESWWRALQAHGEGLVDHALLPTSVPEALAAAQARGLSTLRGPLDGGRLRPDGVRLAWQTARSDTPDLPFLCGDLTPRALRVPEGRARRHANGAIGVACVQLATDDPVGAAAHYRALLGPDIALAQTTQVGEIARLHYRLRGTDFEIFGPPAEAAAAHDGLRTAAAGAPGFDRAHTRSSKRGVGPFALRLLTSIGASTSLLEPGRTHGARIELGTDG